MGTDDLFKRNKQRQGRQPRKSNCRQNRDVKWLFICEGKQTEPNYIKGLLTFFNSKSNSNFKIIPTIKGEGKNTGSLVKSAEKMLSAIDRNIIKQDVPYDRVFIIMDKDSFLDEQFNKAIELGNSIKNCRVLWTNESFELWLLLHFEYTASAIGRNEYSQKLRDIFNQKKLDNNYNKNDENIFSKVTQKGGSLRIAYNNAIKLYNESIKKDNPSQMNPCTKMYELVEILVEYTHMELN